MGILVPSASKLDPRKQLGQDWNFSESRKLLTGLYAKAKLSEVISVRAAYRYGDMWRRYNTTFGTFTDNQGNYSEKYITTPKQYETTHSYYALADVHFDTGPIQHTVAGGYNGTQFYYERGNDVATDLGMSSLSTPLVVAQEPPRTSGSANASRTYYDSLIVGDRALLGPVSVLAGVNYAQIRARSWSFASTCTTAGQCPSGGLSDVVAGAFTPSVGATYRPFTQLALYGSYIEGLLQGSTAPMTAVNAYQIMPPTHSSQLEVGAKWDLARTQWSLALFRMNQINEYLYAEKYYRQDGRQVNMGAELTLSGLVLPRLTAVGGFTWMRSRVTRAASPALEDKVPVNVPQVTGRAFLEYSVPETHGLYVNAGANLNGSRYVDTANADQLDASVTFDAGARYDFKASGHSFTATLFVANLTDQRYWTYYRQGSGLLAGAPRTVSLSIKGSML
jgi:iron complex outermembrane receptor protein